MSLAGASIVRSLFQGLAFFAVAFELSAADLGRLSAVVAFTSFVVSIATLGTYPLTVQDMTTGASGSTSEALSLGYMGQTVILICLVFPSSSLLAWLIPGVSHLLILAVLSSSALLNAVHIAQSSVALAIGEVGRSAGLTLLRIPPALALCGVYLVNQPSLNSALRFYAATSAAMLIAMLLLGRRHYGFSFPQLPDVFSRLKRGWVFSGQSLAEGLNSTADQLMFERLGRPAELGLYAIVVRVFQIGAILPASASDANIDLQLGPAAHSAGTQSEVKRRVIGLALLSVTIGVPLSIALSVLSGVGELANSTRLSLIVAVTILVVSQSRLLGLRLISMGRQVRRTVATAAASLLNIGLNVFLISQLGAEGAAISTLASETALVVTLLHLVRVERRATAS